VSCAYCSASFCENLRVGRQFTHFGGAGNFTQTNAVPLKNGSSCFCCFSKSVKHSRQGNSRRMNMVLPLF
jgi:hypothetical protein